MTERDPAASGKTSAIEEGYVDLYVTVRDYLLAPPCSGGAMEAYERLHELVGLEVRTDI